MPSDQIRVGRLLSLPGYQNVQVLYGTEVAPGESLDQAADRADQVVVAQLRRLAARRLDPLGSFDGPPDDHASLEEHAAADDASLDPGTASPHG